MINILLWILFGAIIGLIAGYIMKSKKGWIARIIVGILGAFLGGFIASLVGIGDLGGRSFNLLNVLIAIGGACLVIIIARALKILQ